MCGVYRRFIVRKVRYNRGVSSPSIIERPRLDGPDSGLGDAARVIVLNDDHNTFEGVAGALAQFIPNVDYAKGMALATTIHNNGQALVWSGNREAAELYWEQLAGVGLTMAPLE
jgi:ATP-dependent Clp protease adaptor protein ClpS